MYDLRTFNMDTKDVDQLREIPITTILGLKQNGRKIFIRCPFHNEKSASLVLYQDGSYHCFGCSAHGNNAIDFLMGLGGSFGEVIEELKKY